MQDWDHKMKCRFCANLDEKGYGNWFCLGKGVLISEECVLGYKGLAIIECCLFKDYKEISKNKYEWLRNVEIEKYRDEQLSKEISDVN